MLHKKNFNWGPALFLILYQVILAITLPLYFYYFTVKISTAVISIILLFITGISITGGYHRYYAHKSYKTNRIVEFFLLLFGTMSCQGSVLRWAFDHRNHHAFVDTDDDPYSIKKGFWYAHFLWLMVNPKPIEPKTVPDLMRNKMVVFQHRYYPYLMVLSNALVFLLCGWLLNDFWGAFFLATWMRIFLLHHFTWFINSLAHTWGDKPFCQEQSAVNNFIISLLTFGEGYHNFHHTFANDYRNGIRWYHFDPTKWLIWTLAKLGLASDLKRMDAYTIKKRMVMERKTLLLDQIKELWYIQKDEMEERIMEISERILEKIAEFNKLKQQYTQLKKQYSHQEMMDALRKEIKALKRSLRADWREWKQLSHGIMKLKPIS